MADERATGIILRTRLLTETSLIVHWLTAETGRLATVAKGARRPASPFRGKLDLFYRCDFSFARSRRSELHVLREVALLETHAPLRRDLGLLQQASYAVRLIEQTTETETPLNEVYALLAGLLAYLATGRPARPRTMFAFELKLLAHLGLDPDLRMTRLSAGAQELARQLAMRDWPALEELTAHRGEARQLSQFLHGFLIYEFGRLAEGRAAATSAGEVTRASLPVE